MRLLDWFRNVRRETSPYRPAIAVLLSQRRLLENLAAYRAAYPTLRFAPVLKSNAYGHGLVPIAKMLQGVGAPFFVVDSLFEARVLRNAGIRTPLLVVGFTSTDNIASSGVRDVAFTITSREQFEETVKSGTKKPVHLKFDTGMHRQGIPAADAPAVAGTLREHPSINVQGVCTHFAAADDPEFDRTNRQLEAWKSVVAALRSAQPEISFIHAAATSGVARASEAGTNVVRLGIGLYGFDTAPHPLLKLLPVLRMESVVTSVRNLAPGDRVGYGDTFTAARAMRIATVPAGYFEGVDRRLSNAGALSIGGVTCPIVGRVSMNITSIDVTAVPNAAVGTRVTVVSDDPDAPNSVRSMAKTAGTIPYDILVHIASHLRRTAIMR